VVLGIGDKAVEIVGLVEGVLLVRSEVADHFGLFEYDFFDAEIFGHAAESDGEDELLCWLGYRPEAVDEMFAVGVEVVLG
jgi:hypothetical protein